MTEIAREGARRMLAEALKAEADAFVAGFADDLLADGRSQGDCQSRTKKGQCTGEIVANGEGLARALARVLATKLTRDKAHWPQASPERHRRLCDQALALRL